MRYLLIFTYVRIPFSLYISSFNKALINKILLQAKNSNVYPKNKSEFYFEGKDILA